jgi:hypothetical protein
MLKWGGVGRPNVVGIDGGTIGLSGAGGEKSELTGERGGDKVRRRNPRRKTYWPKSPTASMICWASSERRRPRKGSGPTQRHVTAEPK